jgi:hypothetical protein
VDNKVDSRLTDFQKAMLEITEIFHDGRKDSEKDDEFVDRLKTSWEEVQSERKKLMENPEIMEELYG